MPPETKEFVDDAEMGGKTETRDADCAGNAADSVVTTVPTRKPGRCFRGGFPGGARGVVSGTNEESYDDEETFVAILPFARKNRTG